jgi:hypothetical protein
VAACAEVAVCRLTFLSLVKDLVAVSTEALMCSVVVAFKINVVITLNSAVCANAVLVRPVVLAGVITGSAEAVNEVVSFGLVGVITAGTVELVVLVVNGV